MMRVTELMSIPIQTASDSTTAGFALSLLLSKGVRHLPVTRDRQLVGIVGYDALASAAPETPVRDLIVEAPPSISSESSITEAMMRLASAERAHEDRPSSIALVVVDEHEKPIGIVTRTDVLWAMLRAGGFAPPTGWIEVEFAPNRVDIRSAFLAIAAEGAMVTGWESLPSTKERYARVRIQVAATTMESIAGSLAAAGYSIVDLGLSDLAEAG